MKNTFQYGNHDGQNDDNGKRRTLLTIKVGAITKWVRDILAIILMWKLIAIIY